GESPFISQIGELMYPYAYSEIKEYYIRSLLFPKEYLYGSLRRLCLESTMGAKHGQFRILKSLILNRISIFKNRYWCAKTFPTYESYLGLITLFPTAKFIYIFRNGLDVVYSRTRFVGFRQGEFSSHCSTWAESVDKYQYLTNVACAIRIRHEDLLHNPQQVFQRLFIFIGVEESSKPLDFITNTIVHPLDKPTETGVKVREIFEKRQPPYADWSSEQRELFKKICGNAMEKAGYEIPF
ncbi:MAG: sulfotransferase, partial [Acidobacteriota bacterium]